MPPLHFWAAGLTIIPTVSYTVYNYVYVPRVTSQSEMERLSDALTRPRQILEQNLIVLGGVGGKLSSWTSPRGQRDVPFVDYVGGSPKRIEDIPNGARFDADLPPYRQPTGVCPQTNGEKLSFFVLMQNLRLQLLASCPHGDVPDPLGAASVPTADDCMWKRLTLASVAAAFAPASLTRRRGLLLSSAGDAQLATSTASDASVGAGFATVNDQHREEILRRIAHTEMEKLFLLPTEGDLRYITAQRIARRANLLQPFDVVVVPSSVETPGLPLLGGERLSRFLGSREDGMLVPKPQHIWVRPRVDPSGNKSGTLTIVDASSEEVNEFNTLPAIGNVVSALPNGHIAAKPFVTMLTAAHGSALDLVGALRQQGFSRMLLAPYLHFRDAALTDGERRRSKFAHWVYQTLFQTLGDSPIDGHPQEMSAGATSAGALITSTISAQLGCTISWRGLAAPAPEGLAAAKRLASRACALLAYTMLRVLGYVAYEYSDDWLTDLRYAAANWLVHDVLDITTSLSAVGDDGGIRMLTDGKRCCDAPPEALGRSPSEGPILLAFTPSLWVEDLALHAAAGVAAKHHRQTREGSIQTLAIASLPGVQFSNYLDGLLKLKADVNVRSRSSLRAGASHRHDLLPLGAAAHDVWCGLPLTPAPLLSVAKLVLPVALGGKSADAAEGRAQQVLDSVAVYCWPVAAVGTQSVVNKAGLNDPLYFAFPDVRVKPTGLDTQVSVELLQNRGLGSDERVFIADEQERVRFERSSQLSSIGGKVGQGKKHTADGGGEEQSSCRVANRVDTAKPIEIDVWKYDRISPSGFPTQQKAFRTTYQSHRRREHPAPSDQPPTSPITQHAGDVFGGLSGFGGKRTISFTIGKPISATPTIEIGEGKATKLLFQFAGIPHAQAILATLTHRLSESVGGDIGSVLATAEFL